MLKLMPILEHMGACSQALAWVTSANHATFAEAWAACPRADWMLWLIARSMPREALVECACDIAETALVHVPASETRPRECIKVTRRWVRGEASIEEVRQARAATYATYAAYAADAATYAAYAADAAADAYYAVAVAGYYACYAADADAAEHRNIIRARVPSGLIERVLYDIAHKHGCAVEVTS